MYYGSTTGYLDSEERDGDRHFARQQFGSFTCHAAAEMHGALQDFVRLSTGCSSPEMFVDYADLKGIGYVSGAQTK